MTETQPERRRAVIVLGEETIAHLLRLPKGWYVLGIRDDFPRQGVIVLVTGPDAPIAAPGMYPYELQTELEFTTPDDSQVLPAVTVRIKYDDAMRAAAGLGVGDDAA